MIAFEDRAERAVRAYKNRAAEKVERNSSPLVMLDTPDVTWTLEAFGHGLTP